MLVDRRFAWQVEGLLEIVFFAGQQEQCVFEHRHQLWEFADDQIGNAHERDNRQELADDAIREEKRDAVGVRGPKEEQDEIGLPLHELAARDDRDERGSKNVEDENNRDRNGQRAKLAVQWCSDGGNEPTEDGDRADARTGQYDRHVVQVAVIERPLVGRHVALRTFDQRWRKAEQRNNPAGEDGHDFDQILSGSRKRDTGDRKGRNRLERQVDQAHDSDRPREDEQRIATLIEDFRRIETGRKGDETEDALDETLVFEREVRGEIEPEKAEADPGDDGDQAGGLGEAVVGSSTVPLDDACEREQPDDRPGHRIRQDSDGKEFPAEPGESRCDHYLFERRTVINPLLLCVPVVRNRPVCSGLGFVFGRWFDRQHRQIGVLDDAFSDAAEQESVHPASAVGAHNDGIGSDRGGVGGDGLAGCAFLETDGRFEPGIAGEGGNLGGDAFALLFEGSFDVVSAEFGGHLADAVVVDDIEDVEIGVVAGRQIDGVVRGLGCGLAAVGWKEDCVVHMGRLGSVIVNESFSLRTAVWYVVVVLIVVRTVVDSTSPVSPFSTPTTDNATAPSSFSATAAADSTVITGEGIDS